MRPANPALVVGSSSRCRCEEPPKPDRIISAAKDVIEGFAPRKKGSPTIGRDYQSQSQQQPSLLPLLTRRAGNLITIAVWQGMKWSAALGSPKSSPNMWHHDAAPIEAQPSSIRLGSM